MICLSGGMGKGSCRSYGGINLFAVLEGCQDLLEAFGGHELAAGFTVRQENILALAQRIRTQVALQSDRCSPPELEVDVQLDDPSILDLPGIEQLDRLEPYGTGNPRPVLCLTGAQVMSRVLVGNGRHLKMKLSKAGITLDTIFFSVGDCVPQVGSRVDVAFYPQINEYRGARTVQLQLIYLRPASDRTQPNPELYEKFCSGTPLTPQEAGVLLPEREEFVALWRYLKRETAAHPVLEDTPARIARGAGQRESLLHTLICLDVMHERGLISLCRQTDLLQIALNPVQEKVDLEDSHILRSLRHIHSQQ